MADKWYSKALTTNQTFNATMDELITQLKRINARQEVIKKVDFFPSSTSAAIGDKILYIYDNAVYRLNNNREWELYFEKSNYYNKNISDTKYQAVLRSGINIKTINNQSLLGSGNIEFDISNINFNNYYDKNYINNNFYSKTYIDSNVTSSLNTTINTVESIKNNYASTAYVSSKISDLINQAPETLDTLGEIAKVLQENQSVVDTLNEAIGLKADKSYVNNQFTTINNSISTMNTTLNTKASMDYVDSAISQAIDSAFNELVTMKFGG